MGNSLQKRKLKNIYSYYPDVAIHRNEFSLIHLREEDVGRLFASFEGLVKTIQAGLKIKPASQGCTGGETVSIPHLLAVLKIVSSGNNKFAVRLFSAFDPNFSGKMNFKDFVFVVWNICTVDTTSLDRLCFDLYKEDGRSGQMIVADIKQVIWDVYGELYSKQVIARRAFFSLDTVDPKADLAVITVNDFIEFCGRHDNLLKPVALLRDKLQAAVVGTAFWHFQLKQRNYMSGGQFMSANKLLHKMRCAQKELDRKRNLNYLKLTYNAGSDEVRAFDDAPPPLTVEQQNAKKIEHKQKIFNEYFKLGSMKNFFTYQGKKYVSPYRGMQKTPSRHVQKKMHVQEKEKRLGIDSEDPESLAFKRTKAKIEKKHLKANRLQDLTDSRDILKEENEEKDMVIEDLEQELEAKDDEIARLKGLLKKKYGNK